LTALAGGAGAVLDGLLGTGFLDFLFLGLGGANQLPTLAVAARTDARLDAPSHTQTQDYQGRHMVIRAIICRVIRATYAMIRLDIVGSVQQRLASDGIVFGLTEDPAMPFTWVIRVIRVIRAI